MSQPGSFSSWSLPMPIASAFARMMTAMTVSRMFPCRSSGPWRLLDSMCAASLRNTSLRRSTTGQSRVSTSCSCSRSRQKDSKSRQISPVRDLQLLRVCGSSSSVTVVAASSSMPPSSFECRVAATYLSLSCLVSATCATHLWTPARISSMDGHFGSQTFIMRWQSAAFSSPAPRMSRRLNWSCCSARVCEHLYRTMLDLLDDTCE
mmetsp:Transcript_112538/g.318380  ORF Transcript_112538/g.318380 Transcript_112538/m.318380 type:complete len:206 (+) Transcript_112538:485-1102(+)